MSLEDAWKRSGLGESIPGGMDPMELTLRYTLSHPGMPTTIVGTVTPEHLCQNLAAATEPLPDEAYDEVRRRIGI